MNVVDRLGHHAAEADLAAARATTPDEHAMQKRIASDYREIQLAWLEYQRSKQWHENEDQAAYLAALPARKGWYARVREWFLEVVNG